MCISGTSLSAGTPPSPGISIGSTFDRKLRERIFCISDSSGVLSASCVVAGIYRSWVGKSRTLLTVLFLPLNT